MLKKPISMHAGTTLRACMVSAYLDLYHSLVPESVAVTMNQPLTIALFSIHWFLTGTTAMPIFCVD